MEILEIRNNVVQPTAEILMIDCFGKLWDRDKGKRKEVALQEFTYVAAMCSRAKSNPFREYDLEIKSEKIIQAIIKKKGWKPDNLVDNAIAWYEDWQANSSASLRYYQANLEALEKTIRFLTEDLDYTEKTNAGNPVYKFTDITRGIKEASNVLKSLNTLRTQVEEELYEASKTKGNKTINHYEK